MGVLVDYAHLSNDCAAKAAFTRTAIKEKKNPGRFVSRDNGIQVPR